LAILLFTFLAYAAALRGLLFYVVEILQRRLFARLVADLAYRLPRTSGNAFDNAYGPELANRFFEIATVQKVTSTLLLDAVSIVLETFLVMALLALNDTRSTEPLVPASAGEFSLPIRDR
jgi:hypothetical protein